jgi:hypothetical protein
MKKQTAYMALIIAIAMLFAVNSNAQNSISSTGKFTANVICQHLIQPDGESVFLGTFVAGVTYTSGIGTQAGSDDNIVFTLEGGYGVTFTVTSTVDDQQPAGTGKYVYLDSWTWEILNGSGWQYASTTNDQLDYDLLELNENDTQHDCEWYAKFKITITGLHSDVDATPASYSFPVSVTAEVNL